MKKLAADKARETSRKLLASSDPIEQALGRYQERMTKLSQEQVKLQREGDKIVLFRLDASNPDTTTVLVMTAITGTLVALLLPAISAAREAARRSASMNNVSHIERLFMLYESDNERLPAYANFDTDGKPLLSWRVHMLPYLGEQDLYEQFHLDEPWDSPHNKKLIPRMPSVYRNPSSRLPAEEGKSGYLGVFGNGSAFTGAKEGITSASVTDGLSRTVNLVQVADDAAEVWTCPADWTIDAENPKKGLGELHPGGWIVGFMDGSVRRIDSDIDERLWKALLTTSGGEAINGGF
jgi:type II secretory pathway pseudopilin PulG